ncbi:MAG: cytochrome P450 [Sphingomonadaceae bacterium]|nr:cytochrome P450 [Sphingomonadaceae bacterium]
MTVFYPPKPKPRAKKPGPVGRLFASLDSSLAPLYARSYAMKMGEVHTPRRRLYFIVQPDLALRVLAESATRYPKSNLMGAMLEHLVGDGIFVSRGQTWARQRRMMDPAFEATRIRAIFPLMREAAEAMAERFGAGAVGEATRVDIEMTHVTADVIFRTIYSRAFTRAEAETIFDNFEKFQKLAWRHGVWTMVGVPPSWSISRRRAKRYAKVIRDLLHAPVRERLERIARGEATPERDLLQSFIEAVDPETGERFDECELVDQIGVMFLAGHETSASSLAWALYMVAMSPEVQARLHAEADAAFAEGPLVFETMRRLPFTRDVFREALRLYPPVSFLSRDATEPETMRGKHIKPGEILFVSPWLSGRSEHHWDNPDAFDPDRFARAETRASEQKAYFPFSRGPRVCMGASFAMQEAVIILATIMREWRVAAAAGHTPDPVARLTLRSRNGIRLDFVRR